MQTAKLRPVCFGRERYRGRGGDGERENSPLEAHRLLLSKKGKRLRNYTGRCRDGALTVLSGAFASNMPSGRDDPGRRAW